MLELIAHILYSFILEESNQQKKMIIELIHIDFNYKTYISFIKIFNFYQKPFFIEKLILKSLLHFLRHHILHIAHWISTQQYFLFYLYLRNNLSHSIKKFT